MRTFPSLALACLLALGTPSLLTSAAADDGHGERWAGADHGVPSHGGDPGDPTRGPTPQTSDGLPGVLAVPLPHHRSTTQTSIRRKWQVAPGVKASVFDEFGPRGRVRAYLLAINYKSSQLRIDYADAGAASTIEPVTRLIGRDHAIAGVNGDFFDIADTGAPLGIGRDRDRGLLHGRFAGWNATFSIDATGRPDIGVNRVTTKIAHHPKIRVGTFNAPEVPPDGIGAYTRQWGRASGSSWTSGQRSHVRAVQIRKQRVVSNRGRLPSGGGIRGTLLVGRGQGARQLEHLRVGTRTSVTSRMKPRARMAITGNEFLVLNGVITATDDQLMHPRTAIGISRDTHEILLLAVDGRQSFSRGYTMVEMADLMMDLGADEALNLDGGGSTTMVARGPRSHGHRGRVRVINSPSDGYPRPVANAVEVTYRPKSFRSAR